MIKRWMLHLSFVSRAVREVLESAAIAFRRRLLKLLPLIPSGDYPSSQLSKA